MRMTKQEQLCLKDAKQLDDIFLGMLAPSIEVKPGTVERCVSKGWLRSEDENHPSGDPVLYLTTKGLRAYQRVQN